MIPWQHLDSTTIPHGGELKLMRRGDEFSIMLGSNELMNSRLFGSEQALAELACAIVADRQAPTLLVGGLGMGFTLRAVLASAPPQAQVVVAELLPAVVGWARGPMAHIFAGSLDDRRVSLREVDVVDLIDGARGEFDAILLDVDNGPEGLTSPANDRLYDFDGLAAAKRALRPGGVLAVWSQGPDAGFAGRLKGSGFTVQEHRVGAGRGGRGRRHVIWLAIR